MNGETPCIHVLSVWARKGAPWNPARCRYYQPAPDRDRFTKWTKTRAPGRRGRGSIPPAGSSTPEYKLSILAEYDGCSESGGTASLSGSYSHSLIDDNVIYPYGAAYDANGNDLCPDSPYWFFCPDGSYSIYDYRSPGELRIDAVGEALAVGRVKTGALTHNLAFGGSMFDRAVDLSPSIVYTWIGDENINQPNVMVSPESPYQQAGPSVLADFNRQSSGLIQDRVQLPGRVSLMAGGRYASVKDFNYSASRGEWLPQYAATFAPVSSLMLYANYGVLLSLGPQAPFWVTNANAYLAPFFTRQAEVGAKFEPDHRMLMTAAFFRMRAPFFYPMGPDDAGNLTFVSEGRETHDGVEVNARARRRTGCD